MAASGKRNGLPRFHPLALLGSWFGAGWAPRAPGTWGSAAALPFAWGITAIAGPIGLAIAAVLIFLLGWFVSSRLVEAGRIQDPQFIVIDEVAGQWLTLVVAPLDPLAYGLGFLLFRVMDIVKPFPASWADRRVGGGLGVMLDDVFAAIYAAMLLAGILYLMEIAHG